MREFFFALTVEEFGEAKKVEGIGCRECAFAGIEQGIHLSEKRGESTKIHLVVPDHAGEWLAGAAAKIVEIELRDERGRDIIVATPAKSRCVQDVTLELDKPDGAEAQAPQRPRRMQQIEMRGELRNVNDAGHGEAIFQERPIESFAVESDEDGTFGDAGGKLLEKRIFLVEVAKEELFDLEAAGVPPGEADEECIGAGAAGEAGSLCVEEEPFVGIFKSGASTARQFFIACTREKIESYGRRRREFGSREPIANGEMLAEFVAGDAATEEQADGIGFVRKAQRLRLGRSVRRWLQGREARELVDDRRHFTVSCSLRVRRSR